MRAGAGASGTGVPGAGEGVGVTGRRGASRSVAEPACDGAACCPEGLAPELGTEGPDVLVGPGDGRCFVGLGGADVVVAFGGGETAVVGGAGDDVLQAGSGAALVLGQAGDDFVQASAGDDEVFGGEGADLLLGGAGSDEMHGGAGDDLVLGGVGDDEVFGGEGADSLQGGVGKDRLDGGRGDDFVVGGPGEDVLVGSHGADTLFGDGGADVLEPGPGGDLVVAGPGDDEVRVHDPCELDEGKVLLGGPGFDRLVLPVPLAEAEAAGLVTSGFEQVVVEPHPERSVCGDCGCALQGGQLSCCSGVGTCDLGNDENDRVVCDCPVGLFGSDCSYDPSEKAFDEDVPDWCDASKPSCYFTNDAGVVGGVLDLTGVDVCDDLPALNYDPPGAAMASEEIAWLMYYPTQPENDEAWADGSFPLVVLGPGNTFSVADYEELAVHLARNGYIVVVAGPSNAMARVSVRTDMLTCARRRLSELVAAGTPASEHWNGAYAYLGHSRGGEAAVMAMSLDLDRGEADPAAAVALAPTAACGARTSGGLPTCRQPPSDGDYPASIYPMSAAAPDGHTPNFLILEGSRDGDETGEGVALYDTMAPEAEAEPPADATLKVMRWFFGVPHAAWATGGPLGAGKGYSLLFLDQWVKGKFVDRDLVTGKAVLPCLADPPSCGAPGVAPVPVFTAYREGGVQSGGRRRVVRQFQAPLDDAEGLGAAVPVGGRIERLVVENTDEPLMIWPPEVLLLQPAHLRGGMLLLDTTTSVQKPTLSDAAVLFGLDGHDPQDPEPFDAAAAGVNVLSFRVLLLPTKDAGGLAQTECEALASKENARELHVRLTLRDADGAISPTLDSADYARVVPPNVAWLPTVGTPPGSCEAPGHWTTVRVPLGDFTGLNYRRLASLSLEVRPEDHGSERVQVLLDTVEFVGHDADSVCGDGLLDRNEACDGEDLGGETCQSVYNVPGDLSCTATCSFDSSGCEFPPSTCGDGKLDPLSEECDDGNNIDGDGCSATCQHDALPNHCVGNPGGPDCACIEIPTSEGVAFYHQGGRYCDEGSVCRPVTDKPGIWRCRSCTSPEYDGLGCPCVTEDQCKAGLVCLGEVPAGADPTQYPFPSEGIGACWQLGLPLEGYCEENCLAQGRVCGSTLKLEGEDDVYFPTVCVIPECADVLEGHACEFEPGHQVCDRDTNQCVEGCVDVENPCDEGQICTTWGECI